MTGNRITSAAFPLLVLYITNSAVAAGWAILVISAPGIIVCLPAGALVDRWDSRRTMLVSGFVRGSAVACICAALIFRGPFRMVPVLIGAALIAEISRILMRLAEHRLSDSLTDPDCAVATIVRTERNNSVVELIGRPLGQILFALAPVLPFAAEAYASMAAISAILAIRKSRPVNEYAKPSAARIRKPRKREGKPAKAFVGEGILWLRLNPYAQVAMLLAAGGVLVGGALEAIFMAEANAADSPHLAVGCVLAAFGVGGCIGSAIAPRLYTRLGYSIVKIQAWVWPAGFAFLAISSGRYILGVGAAMLFFGMSGAMGNIVLDIYLYNKAAENMGARVVSVGFAMSCASFTLGAPLGGMLAERYGMIGAFLIFFSIASTLLLITLVAPATRNVKSRSARQPKSPLTQPSSSAVSGAKLRIPILVEGGVTVFATPEQFKMLRHPMRHRLLSAFSRQSEEVGGLRYCTADEFCTPESGTPTLSSRPHRNFQAIYHVGRDSSAWGNNRQTPSRIDIRGHSTNHSAPRPPPGERRGGRWRKIRKRECRPLRTRMSN